MKTREFPIKKIVDLKEERKKVKNQDKDERTNLEKLITLEVSTLWMLESATELFFDIFTKIKNGEIELKTKEYEQLVHGAVMISDHVLKHREMINNNDGIIEEVEHKEQDIDKLIPEIEEGLEILKRMKIA